MSILSSWSGPLVRLLSNRDRSLKPSAAAFREARFGWTSFVASSAFVSTRKIPCSPLWLLKIICTGAGRGKRFSCELLHTSLDDPVFPYIALSYTWGDSAVRSTIPCGRDGQLLGITRSVSVILDTLLEKSEGLVLWIDAVCINQEDAVEKGHQVRLMKDVYQNAKQTVINLGEPANNSDVALSFIQRIQQVVRGLDTHRSPTYYRSAFETEGFGFPSPEWLALGMLFRRSWFERIWVVQEMALPSSAPMVVCGKHAADWRLLGHVAVFLLHVNLIAMLSLEPHHSTSIGDPPTGVIHVSYMQSTRLEQQKGHSRPLQQLLMDMQAFKATDARDKVYGLLGLAKDADGETLDPDYTATIEQVFLTTSRSLLSRNDSIAILHHAGVGYRRTRLTIPSWVVDWSTYLKNSSNLPGGLKVKYHAAADTKPKIRAGSNPERLIIDGVALDRVEYLGPVRSPEVSYRNLENIPGLKAEVLTWLQGTRETVSQLVPTGAGSAQWEGVRYLTGESLEESFRYTLIANNTLSEEKIPPSECVSYFDIWLEDYIEQQYTRGRASKSSADAEKASHFNVACFMATAGKRFFTTANQYMGVTSPNTQIGDLVVLLLGGITPFVLRENAEFFEGRGYNTHTLVGDAYVHGLMDGEGLDMSRVQEFELT